MSKEFNIKIKNCNNIKTGNIIIHDNKLNVKYGYNGVGKSTISKVLNAFINDSSEEKELLIPFKHRNDESISPELEGYECFKSLSIFNEDYVKNYVFQNDNDILNDSFKVFIKTKEYDKSMDEIDKMLQEITDTLQQDNKLNELFTNIKSFNESIKLTSKDDIDKSSVIYKGIIQGNKIRNIPENLKSFEEFIKSEDITKWIKWHNDGKSFIKNDKCPFCALILNSYTKENIDNLDSEYKKSFVDKLVESINKLTIIQDYLDEASYEKLNNIITSKKITESQEAFLRKVKSEAEMLVNKFDNLKSFRVDILKFQDKIEEEIKNLKIDLAYNDYFKSSIFENKINNINANLDRVIEKAENLQRVINNQKINIHKIITEYQNEVNGFLNNNGYNYNFVIEPNDYNVFLQHKENNSIKVNVERQLSYGEKNAFALVLFMYDAISNNPDLIILDDPISSFDKNKKYGIMNTLFKYPGLFKEKTVLLLTHDYEVIINILKNFSNIEKSISFISIIDDTIKENPIKANNNQSFLDIINSRLNSDIDVINKLVYLRKKYEFLAKGSRLYDFISKILHKELEDYDDMTKFNEYIEEIKNEIKLFDISEVKKKINNFDMLKKIYCDSKVYFEKLQIFRIINEVYIKKIKNTTIKKFINIAYHNENDFIYQLDPSEYNLIPEYIIKECNNLIKDYKEPKN